MRRREGPAIAPSLKTPFGISFSIRVTWEPKKCLILGLSVYSLRPLIETYSILKLWNTLFFDTLVVYLLPKPA